VILHKPYWQVIFTLFSCISKRRAVVLLSTFLTSESALDGEQGGNEQVRILTVLVPPVFRVRFCTKMVLILVDMLLRRFQSSNPNGSGLNHVGSKAAAVPGFGFGNHGAMVAGVDSAVDTVSDEVCKVRLFC
jgi:hypothetical protein